MVNDAEFRTTAITKNKSFQQLFICLFCSRHAAVSVDANSAASPAERQTTAAAAAAASTAVVGDTQQQQCTSAAVTLNDHHQCDSQQSVVATAVAADSPRDSQGVTCNKTESASTTTAAAAATSLSRPICPNLPYSPACSPRFARRRPPLRECRVSVNVQSLDDPNAHQKLNQYKLIDSIGQV